MRKQIATDNYLKTSNKAKAVSLTINGNNKKVIKNSDYYSKLMSLNCSSYLFLPKKLFINFRIFNLITKIFRVILKKKYG